MSLIRDVVGVVDDLGEACLEQVVPYFKDKTRAQVLKALANAADLRLIERVGLAPHIPGRRAGRQAIYAVTGRQAQDTHRQRPLPPRGKYGHIGKVSSVFDLGARA